MRKREPIQSAGANVQEITLAPLAVEDVTQLIADALHCEPERAAPLAQLVHEKTAGNPFFLVQFLHTLAEEGWLAFDHEKARWSWDLNRIHAKRYRDNVVDLMVGKLNRLPLDTQKALEQLACLGNIAPVRVLSFILGQSAGEGPRGTRLPREHRPCPDAFFHPREIARGGRCGSLGRRSSGAGRAPGRLLQVRPRSRSGSRLFVDPGGAARRSAPSNRETACGA